MNLENFKEFEIEKLDVIFGGDGTDRTAYSDANGLGNDPQERKKS